MRRSADDSPVAWLEHHQARVAARHSCYTLFVIFHDRRERPARFNIHAGVIAIACVSMLRKIPPIPRNSFRGNFSSSTTATRKTLRAVFPRTLQFQPARARSSRGTVYFAGPGRMRLGIRKLLKKKSFLRMERPSGFMFLPIARHKGAHEESSDWRTSPSLC